MHAFQVRRNYQTPHYARRHTLSHRCFDVDRAGPCVLQATLTHLSFVSSVLTLLTIFGTVSPPPLSGKTGRATALAFTITNALAAICACAALFIIIISADYRSSMSVAVMNRIVYYLSRLLLSCLILTIVAAALAAHSV